MRRFALTLVVLALGAGSARAAGPAWFPQPAFPAAGAFIAPALSATADNDAVSAWFTSDAGGRSVRIADLPAGPGSATTATFSRGGATQGDPAVATSATGDALVAWRDSAHSVAFSLRQAPGGFATPQVPVGPNTHSTIDSNVAVAADRSGHFLVAYGERIPQLYTTTGGNLTRVALWTVDANTGLVSGPEFVGAQSDAGGFDPVFEVSLAQAPNGAAVLGFYRFQQATIENDILVSSRPGPAAPFSAPSIPTNGAFNSTAPRTAIDPHGRMLVAWRHDALFGGVYEVHAAEAQPGADFAPVGTDSLGTLSDPFSPSEGADIGLDGAGRGTVVWQTCFSATSCGASDSYRTVLAQRLRADGTPDGGVQTVSGHSPDPFMLNPSLAVAPSGAALVAWQRRVNGHDVLEAARRASTGDAFSATAAVPADPDVSRPVAAIDAAGDGIVAWARSGTWVPHLARLDAAPPSPGPIALTGGPATPFEPLGLSVRPTDAVSGVSVRWTFGDGSPAASGAAVRHVYRVRGRRTVTATVTDGAGFSAVATRTLDLGRTTPRPRFLGRASALPASFRAGTGRRRGTTLHVRLASAATLSVRFARLLPGRRRGRRCVTPTRALRHARRCTRAVPLKPGLSRRVRAGRIALAFSGRLAGRALTPGRYRLTFQARNAGGRSKTLSVTIRVLPRR